VVSTCHSYDILRPHIFLCSTEVCGQEYSRHSKKGLDIDRLLFIVIHARRRCMYMNSIFSFITLSRIMNNRSLCGKCGGTLRYAGVKKYDGTMAAPKTPSAFWYGMYCTSFTSAGPTLIPSFLSLTQTQYVCEGKFLHSQIIRALEVA